MPTICMLSQPSKQPQQAQIQQQHSAERMVQQQQQQQKAAAGSCSSCGMVRATGAAAPR
jgi:hypothetical protein